MGCCTSSPHSRRVYRDPGDLDEEFVDPLRYFGTVRAGSNLMPDDIDGLPSTHMEEHLATDSNRLLYQAEMDSGQAYRCYRPVVLCLCTPWGLAYVLAVYGFCSPFILCPWDEACCHVRKEYSTRRWFRVYPNRIAANSPHLRCPYGLFGCGSWTSDVIVNHPFDRGAFGFTSVRCGVLQYLCCMFPVMGGSVARHRCQCNGPLWNRMCTDCGGWWCDEWICQQMFCTYRYEGLADADEAAFAASIALQAYVEGRTLTRDDMDTCIQFWKDHIAEHTDPLGRKRPVCCEPYLVPWCNCKSLYKCIHHKRVIPDDYDEEAVSDEVRAVYNDYERKRLKHVEKWEQFGGPVRHGTACRTLGCRRVFGRKGFFFCTEDLTCQNVCCCCHPDRKASEPAPPPEVHDFDDDWDASTVLIHALGPPPPNVVIRRWRWDPERGENFLDVYPPPPPPKDALDPTGVGNNNNADDDDKKGS